MIPAFQDITSQNHAMKRYYKFQSKIYDKTRWAFLFGRTNLVHQLPIARDAAIRILEVGCGTGYNLHNFASYFVNAQLVGMDVSEDMIALSQKKMEPYSNRVDLLPQAYGERPLLREESFDVVVFSYALTMINPQWENLIEQAYKDIKPGGIIAVVDFHNSGNPLFKMHMKNNHVRMDGHLLPVLENKFSTLSSDVQRAYWGLWEYFSFVGIKPYR
ncbi:class I SAM-dependent methyltransferase [Aureispira anguillae]|uniref:Class I SAM-dependent methyltransferase n=1 Tax=Aureispira anguillae TaxID=2864201 RepID=A0A916DTF5_9BACT|nr:class I SAM-dependent methyltransferase [Aureispira anguillae]BDS11815.1 class I SAM-dependent methyltransferase [Aureispira anguillae]